MRIDIGTFLAVLFLAAWLQPLTSASPSNRSALFSSASFATSSSRLLHRRSARRVTPKPAHHHHSNIDIGEEETDFEEELEYRGGGGEQEQNTVFGFPFGSRMGIKQMQQMLMSEGHSIDCCPSRMETTTPDGGLNRDGLYVTLFRNEKVEQTFYEQTCLPGVEDKPCFFLDRRMHNQSRCVQKRSFTYAMVLNPAYNEEDSNSRSSSVFTQDPSSFNTSNSKWMMDYIQVNSGCACEVKPKHKKKKHDRSKKPKNKRLDF